VIDRNTIGFAFHWCGDRSEMADDLAEAGKIIGSAANSRSIAGKAARRPKKGS